ncbi:MAG: UDP-N-acetylmuramoyl-L-alanine--D-glutamate ligase [Gemmatimonadetes bacterium]|nr:UDP-N-acetylmuramoyl-L-alanine--D-glutamate ligase [Gemmatimonadota bacterium]
MNDKELEEKRIALLGMGVENRSVGRYLAERGIGFSVCDARTEEELPDASEWVHLTRSWHLGPDYLDGLDEFDLLFRTPGISPLNPALVRAREAGASLHSQTRLFLERCPAAVVGITGTKGKGTTCSLLFEMLRDGPYGQVWLGGNMGTPPVDFLDDISASDLVILELSSFQLQDLDRSPAVSVVLNITPDHLDYHADLDEYVKAKKSICRYQSADDTLIVDADCGTASRFAGDSPARPMEFSMSGPVEAGAFLEGGRLWARPFNAEAVPLCHASDLKLRGRHNVANALAAAAAAVAVGAPAGRLAPRLRSFPGLEHRLEHVATRNGVAFCNDSLATTPEAALAAVASFDEPVLLIAGGSSKGADFTALARGIADRGVKALILLVGEEGQRLADAVRACGYSGEIVPGCQGVAEAVAAAMQRAAPGDVVLLSPACASFGMFASYAERGAKFKEAVAEIRE